MKKINVSAEHSYDVLIGEINIDHLKPLLKDCSKVALLYPSEISGMVDQISAEWDLPVELIMIELPEGESQKSAEVLIEIWNTLSEHNFSRADWIIGIGGGATTDLAGFAAASWLRGVNWVSVPTTVAGMVDAAIGGKTGINIPSGKNLVGAFHSPRIVFVDPNFLESLPVDELRSGLAEIIKCGFIADEQILKIFENNPGKLLQWNTAELLEVIGRSIQVKADVVSADLKEASLREILNYGHTLAHAIEGLEEFAWRHGDAVSVGMVFAAELALQVGYCDENLVDRHRSILGSVGLPISYKDLVLPELIERMGRDKKVRNGLLRFILLESVGKIKRLEGASEADLTIAYEKITS
jgi:3-dehydroquinate synthase